MPNKLWIQLALVFFLASCSWKPNSISYQEQYAHLNTSQPTPTFLSESDYALFILVDARHLDYSNSQTFLQTMTKHPSNGCKECSVGHAWILLRGLDKNGKRIEIEGGHSGEWGVVQPKYFEGMMRYALEGDPNPVRYLWEEMQDGVFQQGNGGHIPTFAAKINLTQEEYEAIYSYIQPNAYPYRRYSLTKRQCASFVVQAAALAGINLESEVTIPIAKYALIGGECIKLWSNPEYSQITIATPDLLEKSLIEQVKREGMEYALPWYLRNKSCQAPPFSWDTITRFPERYFRHRSTFPKRYSKASSSRVLTTS